MKLDEFAFFNQQLAGMLRSGIPLEGALKQLARSMEKGRLKQEIEALEKDLGAGVPLAEAVRKRQLPQVYVEVMGAGARSGNLPGVLILLADYYGRVHALSNRLKGLMVYPIILLTGSLGLSLFLSLIFASLVKAIREDFGGVPGLGPAAALFWVAPVGFFLVLAGFIFVLARPKLRHWLRWHAPGLREASLSQSAATIATMLSGGTGFDDSLRLVEQVEADTPAGADIKTWRELLRDGRRKFDELAVRSRVFPPLFVWLVAQGGEDLALGFRRASEIYGARAAAKTDLLLFAALPLAVALVGLLILGQVVSVAGVLSRLLAIF